MKTQITKAWLKSSLVKQRNGPIGTLRLGFEGQFTRFINLTPEYYQNASFENDE